MLPKTLAFVAFFFGIAVAQPSPPPTCNPVCCGAYLASASGALIALLGKESVLPTGSFGTDCTLGNCTTTDVGKQTSCCLYYAELLKYTSGCEAAATTT